METQAQADNPAETATVTPPEAQAPAPVTSADPLASSESLEDLETLKQTFLSTAPPEDESDPAPAETPPATDAPTVEEVPDPPQTEVIEPDPAAAEATETASSSEKGKRYRLRPTETDAEVLELKIENPALTLRECVERVEARRAKGSTATGNVGATKAGEMPPVADGMPATMAETEAKIKELRDSRKTAARELDFEKSYEFDDQIATLERHHYELRFREEKQRDVAQQEYVKITEEAGRKVEEVYPAAKDPNSALAKRMAEYDTWLKDNDPDAHLAPEKEFTIARWAANDLGIAPRIAAVKPVTPSANGQPRQAPRTAPVASGSARTSAPAPVEANWDAMTEDDLHEVKHMALRGHLAPGK